MHQPFPCTDLAWCLCARFACRRPVHVRLIEFPFHFIVSERKQHFCFPLLFCWRQNPRMPCARVVYLIEACITRPTKLHTLIVLFTLFFRDELLRKQSSQLLLFPSHPHTASRTEYILEFIRRHDTPSLFFFTLPKDPRNNTRKQIRLCSHAKKEKQQQQK